MTTAPPPDDPTRLLQRLARRFARGSSDGRLSPTVDGAGALELVRAGATLLDVRENHEWTAGHARGAVHVPLGNLAAAPRRLRKDSPVVVVCASGMRSRTAAKALRELGYDATSLSGGMPTWERAGGEVRR